MIILTKNATLYSNQRLLKEAKEENIELSFINPYTYDLPLKEDSIKREDQVILNRSTGFSFDDYDLDVLRAFEKSNYKSFNQTRYLYLLRDRVKQATFFLENNITSIPTLSLRSTNINSAFSQEQNFIVKSIRSSGGKGTIFIKSRESLTTLLEHFKAKGDLRYIVQPFIESHTEYRVLFIGNNFIGAIKKDTTGSIKGNAEFCSSFKYLEANKLAPQVMKLALKTYESSKLGLAGIDIMQTQSGPLVIEINSVPGIENFEEVSKLNIARLIIKEVARQD